MTPKLSAEVLELVLVGFLTAFSSEAIFSEFAVFFTTVAGASSALLGLIEGLADFSASSLNYLAGWLWRRGRPQPCGRVRVRPLRGDQSRADVDQRRLGGDRAVRVVRRLLRHR